MHDLKRLNLSKTILNAMGILALTWFSCTQKTPVDPTQSVKDDVALLVYVTAQPGQIAVGGAEAEIRARLVDEDGNPLSLKTVNFTTSLGTISVEAVTDSSGWARGILVSGAKPGKAKVTIKFGQIATASVQVEIVASLKAQLKIESNKTELKANGLETAIITVTVMSDSSRGLANAVVVFSSTVGSIAISAVTEASGEAYAILGGFAHPRDTVATVTATCDTMTVALQIRFKGINLMMTAEPNVILADGRSQSRVRVVLKETASLIALAGQRIQFGTSLGTIPGESYTDDEGIAEVYLTSSNIIGTAHVVSYYGNRLSDTVNVSFASQAPSIYSLGPLHVLAKNLLANGLDTTTVTVKVVNEKSEPVSAVAVDFATTAGTITQQAVTGKKGEASALLTASAGETDVVATVSASIASTVSSTTVNFLGVQMESFAVPRTILADGQSVSVVSVIIKQKSSQIAIPGGVVQFGTDLGTITSSVTSNDEGIARAVLTSGTTLGTAHVVAVYGNALRDTVQVIFQESDPTYIEVTASPKVLPADGQSQSVIKATVSDGNRNPVPDGTIVQFDIIQGSGNIQRQRITQDGVATSTLTSGSSPDTAVIRVSVGSLYDDVSVIYTVGDISRIVVSANPADLPADGVTKSEIQATVLDGQDNPIPGIIVEFTATFGDIVQSVRTNSSGIALASYSSTQIGLATIRASVGVISGITTVQVLPGAPFSVTLSYNPGFMFVKDCGKNQTVTIYADVRDAKNNPVIDGTYVLFSIYAHPDSRDSLSTNESLPTVGGRAIVSYTSGTRAGTARIKAEVLDEGGDPLTPPVTGISTEIVIYSGPPYMEDIDNELSTHLTLVERRLNIWAGEDTTLVTALVGDKYNNPVQEGTAVYFTISGGLITTTAYTDDHGIAQVMIHSGNPQPTIDRFYHYVGVADPNLGTEIPGPIPDFELSRVTNSEGGTGENDGIARVIAHTEGVDSLGNSVKVWDHNAIVFSTVINHFTVTTLDDSLRPGEFTTILIEIWDINGNPVVANSDLTASFAPTAAKAELSWTAKKTADPGSCYYSVNFFNIINPLDAQAQPTWSTVTIRIAGPNGVHEESCAIYLSL